MTTHEILTSMFWLMAIGYAIYLGWFVIRALTERRTDRTGRKRPHASARKAAAR